MKQSPMPPRKQPMQRGTGLARSALKAAVRDAAPVRGRGLASSRGDTGPSRRVRMVVLERDGYSCVRCGKGIAGQQASIHHRKLRSQGGRNTPENLIVTCGSGTTGCHGWIHANVTEAQASGWLVKGSQDPALISVMVFSEHGSGMTVFLADDGQYSTEPPAEAAA